MTVTAIIGGTGLNQLETFDLQQCLEVETPFGKPSAPIVKGVFNGHPVMFLARHGNPHCIPPHRINYRANVWALKDCGADAIIGINAVGGIADAADNETLWLPDQLIDYTWGRVSSFCDADVQRVTHIDFTDPYSDALRSQLMAVAEQHGIQLMKGGTYGVTQGPRLETAAEIERMERDGCDLVGMTGMPEAALARELGVDYASIALVVNKAAGKAQEHKVITMTEIERCLASGMRQVHRLLSAFLDAPSRANGP